MDYLEKIYSCEIDKSSFVYLDEKEIMLSNNGLSSKNIWIG